MFHFSRLVGFLAVIALLSMLAPRTSSAVGDLDLLAAGVVPPNVMLVLDNSSSMNNALGASTRIQVAGDALLTLVDQLYPDDGAGGFTATVRLGLARFDPTGGRAGGQILEEISSTNKPQIIAGINSTVADRLGGAPGTGTLLSESLVDVGRYFAGQHGFGSYPAVLTTSPIDLTCRDNFVVFISDGEPKDDQNNHHGAIDLTTTAFSNFVDTIGNADGDANECSLAAPATCIDSPEAGRDDGVTYANATGTDWFDDVAYYLANTDLVPDATLAGVQSVSTYTIGFTVGHPLLSEAATNGKGEFFQANDAAALATALEDSFTSIFNKLQTSFTSAVVPGASIGSGNALYNSFFESSNEPVWEGHLEALRITPAGVIQDGNLATAVDANGVLLPTRVPFWDAGEVLKTDTSRTIFTTVAGARAAFDNTRTAAELGIVLGDAPAYPNYPASGVDTLAELEDAIVAYVHGKDAFDEDNNANATEMRDIVFGDIFHSEPRAIAAPTRLTITEPGYLGFYNAYKDRDRVVYTGANDGMLHAFDAGQFALGDDASTPELEFQYYTPGTGNELWGYVPGHQLDHVKLLPRNSPRTEYFVDGPITVADAWLGDIVTVNDAKDPEEWATVMISGYREGGSGYIALDITDPGATSTDPHFPYPSLLWEFSDADLGESWSDAVVTRVKLEAAAGALDKCGIPDGDGDCRERWVAIFGGGYAADGDPNRTSYIDDPLDPSWSDTSKAIYMVDLYTGALIAKVEFDPAGVEGPDDMKFSLPSAPAVLDLNFDGFADVVYIGDLGGQVWKWDIHDVGADTDLDPLIDNWSAGVFFQTPPVTLASTDLHYRSFFYPPVGSFLKGKLTLAFGSGERHDLSYPGDNTVADENRFYVVQDNIPFGALSIPVTAVTDTDLTDITALDTDTNPLDGGFRFDIAEGEKFVTNVTVFAGFVIVGSYTPVQTADLCATASGQAFLHIFKLSSGKGFFDDPLAPPSEDRRTFVGGGLPSDPTVTVSDDPNNDTILLKTSDGNRILSIDAPPRTDPTGSLIYWRQQL